MFVFAPTNVAGKTNTAPTQIAAPSNFGLDFAAFPQIDIGNAVEFQIPPAIEFPVAGPPTLLPEDVPLVPTTPGQPVPEPSSLAMLATALAGLGAYRVIKVRKGGVKLPHGCRRRSLYSAQRSARLLAVTNSDPEVDHFAVSDGKQIVFRTPAGECRDDG